MIALKNTIIIWSDKNNIIIFLKEVYYKLDEIISCKQLIKIRSLKKLITILQL